MHHININDIDLPTKAKKVAAYKRQLKQALVSPSISEEMKVKIRKRIQELGVDRDYLNSEPLIQAVDE